jgi:hypothetical protein
MSKFLLIWECWYYWYYWSVSNTWSQRKVSQLLQCSKAVWQQCCTVWRQVDTLKKDSCLCDLLTEIVHSSELRICCQRRIKSIQPLSTAEVERLFSQVALIKTSHRANIKTETLSKILNIKYNCYLYFQLFASMHLHDSLFIYILLHMYRNAR